MFNGGGAQISGGGISMADTLGASPSVGVRVVRNTATSLRLDRYSNAQAVSNGEVVEVNLAMALLTTDNLIDADGDDAGAGGMAASTLFYVYVSNGGATFAPNQMRASATAPTVVEGVYYLGASGNAANWRFLAFVATDAAAELRDDPAARLVVNYYNRRPLSLFACPAYVDDNAQTTYALNTAAFAPINGGTGDSVTWISNGEDAAWLQADAHFSSAGASTAYVGVGFDSTTTPDDVGACRSSGQSTTTGLAKTLAAGVHVAHLLACTQGTAYSVVADTARFGSSADPSATALSGWCMG